MYKALAAAGLTHSGDAVVPVHDGGAAAGNAAGAEGYGLNLFALRPDFAGV